MLRPALRPPMRAPMRSANAPSEGVGVPAWAVGSEWRQFEGDKGSLPAVAVTSASARWAKTKAGLLVPFSANVPAITDDGLQVGPGRTNTCKWSQDLSTLPWGTDQGAVTVNAALAPDGTMTADRFVPNTSSNIHRMTTAPQGGAGVGTVYDIAVFAKTAGYRYLYMNANARVTARATFDLLAGTIVSGGTGTGTALIEPYIDGWYRCSLLGLGAGDGTGQHFYQVNQAQTNATDETFTGDGTSGILLWQEDFVQSGYRGPIIPTTNASVAAAGDQAVIDLTAKSGQSESFVVDAMVLGSADTNVLWSRNDGTANNWYGLIRDGTKLDFRVIAGGVTYADIELGNLPTGRFTVAGAVGANFAKARLVGGSDTAADTSVTLPAVTQMAFFGDGYAATRNAYGVFDKVTRTGGAGNQNGYDDAWARAQLAAA